MTQMVKLSSYSQLHQWSCIQYNHYTSRKSTQGHLPTDCFLFRSTGCNLALLHSYMTQHGHIHELCSSRLLARIFHTWRKTAQVERIDYIPMTQVSLCRAWIALMCWKEVRYARLNFKASTEASYHTHFPRDLVLELLYHVPKNKKDTVSF